ncbi:hypothetical protein BDZ89DRAFT_1133739 [Hymenopellis radicata]|nr:hypothetical protein BDZ89DRAFT_1133739 [Hymenopellis radicata]
MCRFHFQKLKNQNSLKFLTWGPDDIEPYNPDKCHVPLGTDPKSWTSHRPTSTHQHPPPTSPPAFILCETDTVSKCLHALARDEETITRLIVRPFMEEGKFGAYVGLVRSSFAECGFGAQATCEGRGGGESEGIAFEVRVAESGGEEGRADVMKRPGFVGVIITRMGTRFHLRVHLPYLMIDGHGSVRVRPHRPSISLPHGELGPTHVLHVHVLHVQLHGKLPAPYPIRLEEVKTPSPRGRQSRHRTYVVQNSAIEAPIAGMSFFFFFFASTPPT